ncbi:uncharacterized protein Dana_GF27853, partial [Drosophila ananassae]
MYRSGEMNVWNTRIASPWYSSSCQPPIRAPAGMDFNDSSSGNSRGFNRFQELRPAIKMESNRSGQSYQSGFGVRRGNDSDDRSLNTSPGSNSFIKAQRLCHMTAVPSNVVAMPEKDTQNSACQTAYEDEAGLHFCCDGCRAVQDEMRSFMRQT